MQRKNIQLSYLHDLRDMKKQHGVDNPHGQFFGPQKSAGIYLNALSTKCCFYRNSNKRGLTCNQTRLARSFSIKISASESSVHEFHLITSNLNSEFDTIDLFTDTAAILN